MQKIQKKSKRILPRQNDRLKKILSKLEQMYPDANCALVHETPLQLLMSTILSAQCTDERVNQVTPMLFKKYPNVESLASAEREDLENVIKSTGFFRNKAKSIQGAAKSILEKFSGKVPQTMEGLISLPGVGRKTANVVLGNVFGKNEGVVVDTHVSRLSQRLGFTKRKDPVRIEQDLMKIVPMDKWTIFSHWLISHGRKVCKAVRPRCAECELKLLCPSRLA